MTTEILGFFIIVGILIVFIVRRDMWNTPSNKADEVEEASVKMRLQMEHSADAIITRMESHIHQLEDLVAAADERARDLEQKLSAVRADQERAQQRAEKEFAAMRAAQNAYYPPSVRDPYAPGFDPAMRNQAGGPRGAYPPRVPQQPRSLDPIGRVSSLQRWEYAGGGGQDRRRGEEDFADALSASMYAAGAAYEPAVPQETYYEGGDYPQGGAYGKPGYEGAAYGEASYPRDIRRESGWDDYREPPRSGAGRRPVQTIPVEMAVEDTPAVIVESRLGARSAPSAPAEEPEPEGGFSRDQMEALANMEAEVVVSSSVADVVDLPLHPEEEAEIAYGDSLGDEEEDAHVIADGEAFTEADDLQPEDDFYSEADIYSEDEEPEDYGLPMDDIGEGQSGEESGAENGPAEDDETFDDLPEEEFEAPEDTTASEESAPEQISLWSTEEGAVRSVQEDASTGWTEPEPDDGETDGEENSLTAPGPEIEREDQLSSYEEYDDDGDDGASDDSEDGDDAGETEDRLNPRPPSPAIRARELLESGMPIEDVVRETGMGRNAVELLSQMAKGKARAQDED